MKGVILAGGYGKRLRPLTDERPKPMIEVLNKPIIGWQIEWLKKNGIREVVICAGYMREQLINYIGSGKKLSVRAEYAMEKEPLGTGGALKNAESLLSGEDMFFMLNGDILTNLGIVSLKKRLTSDLTGTLAVVPLPSPFGIVEMTRTKVTGFTEKPKISQFWINAGVYCFSGEIFKYLPKKGNIEKTSLPLLAKKGRLRAVKYQDVFWRSIDSHKDIEEAGKELRSLRKRRSRPG